jgi:hypothetical protein
MTVACPTGPTPEWRERDVHAGGGRRSRDPSPGDETRSKLPFYFAVGVEKESFVVDLEMRVVECSTLGARRFAPNRRRPAARRDNRRAGAEIDWPAELMTG